MHSDYIYLKALLNRQDEESYIEAQNIYIVLTYLGYHIDPDIINYFESIENKKNDEDKTNYFQYIDILHGLNKSLIYLIDDGTLNHNDFL